MREIHDDPEHCAIVTTLNHIGSKWKPVIMVLLLDGNLRFGKLSIFLPSISRKVLTQQLRELEADGLIHRHAFGEKPPRVEYEISEKGKSLIPVFQAMYDWGKLQELQPA